ncbi:MAG TPA: hypothetical protein VE011_07015 [Candidatus Dormibacteraeota bacterium]|nr:hypothetical protein [Candidatus Dormibacteraeota bacterium]
MSLDVASQLALSIPRLAEDWLVTGDYLDLPTVALGFLAERVSELDQVPPAIDWSPLFSRIEQMLTQADTTLREVLITGFLEGLQNVDSNHGRDTQRWEPLLGAHTRTAWRGLNDFWNLKGTWSAVMSRDIPPR